MNGHNNSSLLNSVQQCFLSLCFVEANVTTKFYHLLQRFVRNSNFIDLNKCVNKRRCSRSNKTVLSEYFQMLRYLQDFSQRIISRTHEIQGQVNWLVHEAKVNTTNTASGKYFMCWLIAM